MTQAEAMECGALNMLFGCGQVPSGGRVLIVHEPDTAGYYDTDIVRAVANTARKHALQADLFEVEFDPTASQIHPSLYQQMTISDLTVFLARLGDQLRFQAMPEGTNALISYALNATALASPFATTPHTAFMRLKTCIDTATEQSRHIRITCPNGTEVEGKLALDGSERTDVGLRRFPMSVPTPVPASSFSGRVALCGFLTGTGSMYYEPYSCLFDGPVFALLKQGCLAGFEGGVQDVARANAHYDHVSEMHGIDRNFVHSWHAGIHPGCAFPTSALDDLLRWGGSAFGNPRVLHFHTCGAYAPGEISWNLLDPTVEFDGIAVWQNGHFHPERIAGGAEILSDFPNVKAIFETPDRRVGL